MKKILFTFILFASIISGGIAGKETSYTGTNVNHNGIHINTVDPHPIG